MQPSPGSEWIFELCHLARGICIFVASGYRLILPVFIICRSSWPLGSFYGLCHREDCCWAKCTHKILGSVWWGHWAGRERVGGWGEAVLANLKLSFLLQEKTLQHVLANLPHTASQRRQEGWASLLMVEVKPEHAQQLGRPMWWQQHPAPSGDVLPAPPGTFPSSLASSWINLR